MKRSGGVIALVTGAAGFLGSFLVDALLARGYRVIGVDDLSTGSLENVTDAWSTGRFIFRSSDVSASLEEIDGVDVVFHFASPSGREDCARLAAETLRVNTRGTELCCDLALRNRARLVYASAAAVYDVPLPSRPSSWYAEAKRCGEAIVNAYANGSGLDARIVRIFNTYGPRTRPESGSIVPSFIEQALRHEPFTVFGTGMQTRSLAYAGDTIDTVVRFSELRSPAYDVVNVGSNREVTVLQVARLVAEFAGVPWDVRFAPARPDDAYRRRPDLHRVEEMFDSLPQTWLERGLRRTIAWYRDVRGSRDPSRAEAGII